jgi:hypothetical protein
VTEPTPGLHPAQNRALRECYAFTRQLAEHWRGLASRLAPDPPAEALAFGADLADRLLTELGERTASYGLFGRPAAQGVGASLAGARSVVADRALERNQAARLAVLDGQHVVTLLAYLAALARARGDADLAGWCELWERRLSVSVDAVRRAAVAIAEDPDRAIAPADASALGRAGVATATALGTFGEWFDRQTGRAHED